MYLEISERLNIDLSRVFAIGDSIRDIKAALASGCKPLGVKTGNGSQLSDEMPDLDIFDDLFDAVQFVIENDNALFVNENFNGRIWRIDLGSDPKKTDEKGNSWISYYGIELGRTNQFHPNLNIEGAMWAKNICLDDKAVNWEFKEDFINRFIIRYGQDFNYGVPYYRGSSITTWDTMRNFSS